MINLETTFDDHVAVNGRSQSAILSDRSPITCIFDFFNLAN
ncbi:hypothetical protein [Nostoc sp.]